MYSEEETLRIELPEQYVDSSLFDVFTDATRKNHIKHLVIVQKYYDGYNLYNDDSLVIIPGTISHLTEVESITIRAKIETLPRSLCSLKKLELLDLTGCYNIESIPSEVLTMPNLKIKIGDTTTPASEVVIITVPERAISSDIFFCSVS